VHFYGSVSRRQACKAFDHPIGDLSKELEGHPLGGGMLKLEPREAGSVLIPLARDVREEADLNLIRAGIDTAREWRHYGKLSAAVPSA